MTDHPITLPPELIDEWRRAPEYTDGLGKLTMVTITIDRLQYIATQSARWGADQELEACCEWVSQWRCMVGGNRPEVGLRASRRPKPPSLKEQALRILVENGTTLDGRIELEPEDIPIILKALEQLDD